MSTLLVFSVLDDLPAEAVLVFAAIRATSFIFIMASAVWSNPTPTKPLLRKKRSFLSSAFGALRLGSTSEYGPSVRKLIHAGDDGYSSFRPLGAVNVMGGGNFVAFSFSVGSTIRR